MQKLSLLDLSFPGNRAISRKERVTGSVTFDAVMVALAAWFVAGLYLDGWAHQHIPGMETFFTPWHGVLYSGFFACAGFLFFNLITNMWRGYALKNALPAGYELSLLGAMIFSAGGVGDFIWHTLFGIEANNEALLSPTHLILALGMTLILTGPLRAAWYRLDKAAGRWRDQLPMVLSLTFMLSMFTFFTMYAHPFGRTLAATVSSPRAGADSYGLLSQQGLENVEFYEQTVGIAGVLIQTALLMGVVLLLARRGAFPFGGLTLVLGLSTALMVFMRAQSFYVDVTLSTGPWPLIAVAVVTGLAADVLFWWLKPSAARPTTLRLFAFVVPVILYSLYFSALMVFGGGIWWSIHLWAGVTVLAGVTGFLLSYAFVPPALAEEQPA